MKYIIMADGKGRRWNNYLERPKHLIEVNGENLLERCVRLLREFDDTCDIIITSRDQRYEVEGAVRYEPLNNSLEIDRFTEELIEDNSCFLYGDTVYTEEAIKRIIYTPAEDVLFFGNESSIMGIKVTEGKLFKDHCNHVRKLYLENIINKCIGWQVYQSITNQGFAEKAAYAGKFVWLEKAHNINTPEDLKRAENKMELWSYKDEDKEDIQENYGFKICV